MRGEIMQLIRKIGRLEEVVNQVQNGDVIILYEKNDFKEHFFAFLDFSRWESHPEGIIIQKDNKIFLNNECFYENKDKDLISWDVCDQNIIIQEGDKFILNNNVICMGKVDGWAVHPKGIIIQKDNKIFLNGDFLCSVNPICNPNLGPGIFYKNKILFDNRNLLYGEDWDSWAAHPKGIIIQKGNKLFLNNKDLLYKGRLDNWAPHQKGFIVQAGKRLILNGEELLYRGRFDGWGSCSYSVIIQKNKRFLFNGEDLVYEGKFNRLEPHPNGIIIEKYEYRNTQIFLKVYNP